MTDLFSTPKTQDLYSAKDIEILEGLDPVRLRPGMYIGGTNTHALHHLSIEVLDNSIDEAIAGHAKKIDVILHDDFSLTIKDNGRGIPIDPHPKFPEKSALEVILTTLHSGGKFKEGAYETSGGLHGVGISVVNALSDHFEVRVGRDHKLWGQTYCRGVPQGPLEFIEETSEKGTQVRFHPDPEIFGNVRRFSPDRLYKLLRAKAFLCKGVKIRWLSEVTCEDCPTKETLCFPNGLSDFVQSEVPLESRLNEKIYADTLKTSQGRVEWAITWSPSLENQKFSFCNTIETPLGGTHENGFRQALTRAIRRYGDLSNQKKAKQITADDVFLNAFSVLSVFIKNPQFQGQTKEKLTNSEVTKFIDNVVKDHFELWLQTNKNDAQKIFEGILSNSEYRLRRKLEKETNRQTATRRLRLPGKLTDCSKRTRENTEIFLVEGDSAGGTVKQARSRETQAVLPLRGKILNVAAATIEKKVANQEIQDLTLALGCGRGKECRLENLRYERVIIMTDADVDGAHIASLLMTFFIRDMRPLVEKGHLFLAMPPLYRITQGTKAYYIQNDEEKERLLKTKLKDKKIEVSRFKGLGEMSWQQLKETTMDPTKRSLLRVTLPHEEDIDSFVDRLMGRNPEARFNFIKDNAQYVTELDI